MKLITKAIEKKLIANAEASAKTGETAAPVVKFFTPWGGATWLICDGQEMGDDMELFGLCDLGVGCPELGSVMLSDLEELRGPGGLKVERDLWFDAGNKGISEYADEARAAQRIVA